MSSEADYHESQTGPPAKKIKPSDTEKNGTKSDHIIKSLDGFSVDSVLATDTRTKTVTVCGTFAGNTTDQAVIVAEKQPLTPECFERLFSSTTTLKCNLQNDIYGQFEAEAGEGLGAVKLTTVYPATSRHVQKYSEQKLYLIQETPEDYNNITRPFIESQALRKQVWKGNTHCEPCLTTSSNTINSVIVV